MTVVSVTEKHVSASYFFLSLMANITSMLDFKSKLISPCQIMQVSWGVRRGGGGEERPLATSVGQKSTVLAGASGTSLPGIRMFSGTSKVPFNLYNSLKY